MDARFAQRMQRWKKKLATLKEGTPAHTKHLKAKPKPKKVPKPLPKAADWGAFKLFTRTRDTSSRPAQTYSAPASSLQK